MVDLLKSALFRGGLTSETLETLLEGESGVTNDESAQSDYTSSDTLARQKGSSKPVGAVHHNSSSPYSDESTFGEYSRFDDKSRSFRRRLSYDILHSSLDIPAKFEDEDEDFDPAPAQRVPVHDQRTVFITNLHDRTTHKDLASFIRGGRVLDIFVRNDRSATVSFVEGAAQFLAYAKRNDIYLHTKRVRGNSKGRLLIALIACSSICVGVIGSSMCHRTLQTRLPTEPHGI